MKFSYPQSVRWCLDILNVVDDAVILTNISSRIEFLNPAAERLTGWISDDAQGKKIDEVVLLLHHNIRNITGEYLEKVFSGEGTRTLDMDTIFIKGDGLERNISGKILPVIDDEGNIAGAVIILHDSLLVAGPSEINHAAKHLSYTRKEELLQISKIDQQSTELTLHSLFNAIPESLFLMNRQGILLEVNEFFAARFGRSSEECCGLNVYDLLTPDITEHRRKKVEEVLQTGKQVAFENEMDGKWLLHTICPVESSNGEVERMVVFSMDITMLKHSMDNLKAAQYCLDADNKALSKLYEISALFLREGNIEEVFEKVIEAALAISGAEMGNIRLVDPKTGQLKLVSQQGYHHWRLKYHDTNGDENGLSNKQIMFEDKAQDFPVVDENELAEQVAAGIWAVQSTSLRSRNGELLGILATYFHSSSKLENRVLTLLDLLASQTADIIERAEKEDALRQSEEHRRLSQKAAECGSWAWDFQTHLHIWSAELWALYGIDPEGQVPSYELWRSTLHPDDLERVEKLVQESAYTGGELHAEWRVCNHQGNERWLMVRGSTISNAQGKPAKMVGIVIDVTKRKQMDKLLAESNERHQFLFNNILNGVAYCRIIFEDGRPADFIFEEVNARFEILTGLNGLVGKKASEAIPGICESNPELIENFGQVVLSGIADRFEISIDPLHLWLDITAYYTKNGCFAAVFDDITERKLTEKALIESERKFRSITEQMSEMVFIVNANGSLTYVSHAVEKIFGYKPHEVIGHAFNEYLAEEEIPRALAIFHETLQDHLADNIHEFKLRKKDFSFLYAEIHIHYYQDQDSFGMVGLIRDITERKYNEELRIQYEHELLESRQFLQNIYDTVNHSIFVVDVLPDGSYRYKGINQLHETLTGIRNEDISGKTPEELLDPAVASAVVRHYDTCIGDGRSIQYEECLPFKGKMTWWTTLLSPVRNESGRIYRIIGTSTNITDRKLAEEKLKKLSVAVQQSPAVVVITDPLGNIEYINPTFTQHTGYSVAEVIGKNPRILQSGLMAKEVYEELWQTILSGEVWHGEFYNRKKNGELYWEVAVISAIVNNEGAITNFVAVKEDITEKKKLWIELVAAKEKAEESDRLKTAFLANISHEIRTPMNGILGFSELLKDPHLSGAEQAEYIDLIHQSGQRMLTLINDIIDISRIEAGETMLQITETPVNQLLQELHAFFKPQAVQNGLGLSCIAGLSDQESIIVTDSSKLTQILTNLIQNALKFTLEGSIAFGYTAKEHMLEFYVTDTGIGIPPEMNESIFERFRQVDSSITRHHEGSGLGLSISKAYVALLGGTIRVESVPGKGSSFLFTLPYTAPGSLKKPDQYPESQEAIGLPRNLTMLIAEDDEVSALLLQKSLNGENLIIHQARNGREAVRQVEKHPEINIVLMDINMPVMNGLEATRAIKRLQPELPVIAQTAFTAVADKEKAKEAGCAGFITKPINRMELLELIKKLLKR
jgi:PAS domain S-box-containing protein